MSQNPAQARLAKRPRSSTTLPRLETVARQYSVTPPSSHESYESNTSIVSGASEDRFPPLLRPLRLDERMARRVSQSQAPRGLTLPGQEPSGSQPQEHADPVAAWVNDVNRKLAKYPWHAPPVALEASTSGPSHPTRGRRSSSVSAASQPHARSASAPPPDTQMRRTCTRTKKPVKRYGYV